MNNRSSIKVSTHVARDFLQNSDYFNTVPKVVWEYVSNSLDNCRDGQIVNIAVSISSSQIEIADDAIGMSREDLKHFFTMHGENRQRKKGKKVRGRFGTGKCAAFGVANSFQIDTVKDGKQNIIELTREDIEKAIDGEPFPVRDLIVEMQTEQSNGTIIRIKDLNIRKLDIEGTTSYLERQVGRQRQRAHILINGQECQYHELSFIEKQEIPAPIEVSSELGDISLTIKISPVPLDQDFNGIDIYSNGNWHQTTLAGIENKEMSQFLFGEVDVPLLENGQWKISPFDNTRNNLLNVQNLGVAILLGWIYQELDRTRRQLVDKERQRRRSEETKRLQQEASKIAEILNRDFLEQESDFEFAKQIAARQGKVGKTIDFLNNSSEPLPGDGVQPTSYQEAGHKHENGTSNHHRETGEGETPRSGPSLITGEQTGSPKVGDANSKKQRRGIFSIEYKNLTAGQNRSQYDVATKTIFINLDHPQIAGVYTASNKDMTARQFREMSYEVATVEYALAIPFEKVEQFGDLYHASDALFDVGETINRVTRQFAALSNPVPT